MAHHLEMTALLHFEKKPVSQVLFGKINMFKKTLLKNTSKVFTSLKILDKTVHSLLSYGPSNLLFCFSKFCKG